MYRLIVFLHVISAFAFMLLHGAAAVVMFRLRKEIEPERIGMLLELARSNQAFTYASLGMQLLTGILLGFLGHWWGRGWIWTSLGTLVAIILLMGYFGRGYFDPLVKAVTPSENPGHITITRQELSALIAAGQPVLMTIIGIGGWFFIVWLMMFKPF